jgi:WD40 repeat protein
LTGGKDCKIEIFNTKYEHLLSFEIYSLIPTSLEAHIRAVTIDENKKKIGLGLYSSEIYELSYSTLDKNFNVTAVQVNQSHYAKSNKWTNEVWGLTILPDDDRFITCSDDSTIRMWSTSERRCIRRLNLNIDKNGMVLAPDSKTLDTRGCSKLRSVDINRDGTLLAVGCMDGTVRIVAISKEGKWKQVSMVKQRNKWVQDLKFSPDGTMLAVGSHDAVIDVYNAQTLKLVSRIKKHSSAITHLDWSLDSLYLHSTCQAYELLYFSARSGKQITEGASSLKDEGWATWTAVLGWPVQGIYRSEMDGTDVNMVHRSHRVHGDGYKLLAVGEDSSLLRVYRYPCLKKNAGSLVGRGHSSHVTNVRFNMTDTYLYSTGGEDQCVMQWKITPRNSN